MVSKLSLLSALLAVTLLLSTAFSQQKPQPTPAEEEDPVKVFTEEVRLPVVAVDQFGHYDPSVTLDDILVLEDGVIQQIRSVRHLPANVLLVLDTGGEISGTGGIHKQLSLTREVAVALLGQLPAETWVETMQFNNSSQVLHSWTRDRELVLKTLKTKLSSGKRARFSDAMVAAAKELKERPEGSRHVVFITDGVDSPGGKISRANALQQLATARATVHVISYTELVRQKNKKNSEKLETGQLPTSRDPITHQDPTLPPGTTRNPIFGATIRFDPAMKRQRKAYEAEVKRSQEALTQLADDGGGTIFLPKSAEEMMAQSREAGREIGSEYVVTYRPKRSLATARPGEYRKVEVASRRVGLSLRSRRGYVVPTLP